MKKSKKLFGKLRRLIKTPKDYTNFVNELILAVKDNRNISDEAMMDGWTIGVIYANAKYIRSLMLTDYSLPPMTDNEIQQLEHCIIWLQNNENALVKLIHEKSAIWRDDEGLNIT